MKKRSMFVIAATAALSISCSSFQSTEINPTENTLSGTGSLRFNVANGEETTVLAKYGAGGNGHVEGVEHIYLTISEVQLHLAGNSPEPGWKTVATPNQTFDFLELVNGLTAPLDLYALPEGHYTQIRLILSDETVTDEDGNEVAANNIVINGESFPIVIPSAYKTGIKCVRSFFIEEGETAEICLAFDGFKAIHNSAGNGYMMRPAYRTFKCDGSGEETVSEEPEEIEEPEETPEEPEKIEEPEEEVPQDILEEDE